MSATNSTSSAFAIGLRAILWFVLAGLTLLCLPVVTSLSWWLIVGMVVLAMIVALPVWLVMRRIRRGRTSGSAYFTGSLALAMLLICAAGLPIYYLAYRGEADPMVLPLVTLSNGDKTVAYQGMVHIGSESFYKSVVYDLEAALADGYALFYEGVQPADADAHRWFNAWMGTSAGLRESYKALAELCGQQFQLDYFELLEKDKQANPGRHHTADVTERQMLDEWNRLHPDNPWRAEDHPASPPNAADGGATADGMVQLMQWLKSGPERRLAVGGIVCRAMLTRAVDQEKPANDKDPIILDFRNRNLVDEILSYPGEKIYVTYGAAHLPGVIALLKERDPTWKVTSVKWLRAIRAPEQLEGKLTPDA